MVSAITIRKNPRLNPNSGPFHSRCSYLRELLKEVWTSKKRFKKFWCKYTFGPYILGHFSIWSLNWFCSYVNPWFFKIAPIVNLVTEKTDVANRSARCQSQLIKYCRKCQRIPLNPTRPSRDRAMSRSYLFSFTWWSRDRAYQLPLATP